MPLCKENRSNDFAIVISEFKDGKTLFRDLTF